MNHNLSGDTSKGNAFIVQRVYLNCPMVIEGHMLLANFHVMSTKDFGVIFRMVYFHSRLSWKRVDFRIPEEVEFPFLRSDSILPARVFSALGPKKLLSSGCSRFLTTMVDIKIRSQVLEVIPVVREFPDVFHEDLSGSLLGLEIEVYIDLILCTNHIYKAPCMMPLAAMKELRKHLEELFMKTFIYPSISLWRALMLLRKRKITT